jgi:hypothetical protein
MNRRQFTASLGAVATLPLLPLPLKAATTAPAALPPAAYAWAHFIARAQPSLSAAKLARFLKVDGTVATQLFNQLVRDGVLGAPSAIGTAKALQPMQQPTHTSLATRIHSAAKALVKEQPLDLKCANTAPQESADASPDEPVQDSPAQG